MKRIVSRMIRPARSLLTAVVALITCLSILPAHAVASTMEVEIETMIEPVAATAILLDGDKPAVTLPAQWRRARPGLIIVSIDQKLPAKAEGFLTAMVKDAEGTTAYAQVKATQPPELRSSMFTLEACQPQDISAADIETKIATLQQLVEVRLKLRTNLRTKVNALLTPAVIEKVTNLERGFGIARGTPLSLDLHPTELNERISRVIMAIKRLKSAREASAPAQEQK